MSVDSETRGGVIVSSTSNSSIVLKFALVISLLVNSWLFVENYNLNQDIQELHATFESQDAFHQERYNSCIIERLALHQNHEDLRESLATCKEEIKEVHRTYTFCVKEEVANWVNDGFEKISVRAQDSYKIISDTLHEIPVKETFDSLVNRTVNFKSSSTYNATKEVLGSVLETVKELPVKETFNSIANKTRSLKNSSVYNKTKEALGSVLETLQKVPVSETLESIVNKTVEFRNSSTYNKTKEVLGSALEGVANKATEYGKVASGWLGNVMSKVTSEAKSAYESAKEKLDKSSTKGESEENKKSSS